VVDTPDFVLARRIGVAGEVRRARELRGLVKSPICCGIKPSRVSGGAHGYLRKIGYGERAQGLTGWP
jgi:hypothetical protein